MNKDDIKRAYIRYAVNEVTDNTMTLGEFTKKIETDKDFKKKYFDGK